LTSRSAPHGAWRQVPGPPEDAQPAHQHRDAGGSFFLDHAGLDIRVPLFIKQGEKVKVSTETRDFAGRA
jgi:hypothetical protein